MQQHASMVWDPASVTPRPWSSVASFYRDIAERNDDFAPLRDLAEHVLGAPYAASLAAATSGTALLVVPRNSLAKTFEPAETNALAEDATSWAREALRIDVDLSGAVRLTLLEERDGKRVTVACSSQGLRAAFERALRRPGRIA